MPFCFCNRKPRSFGYFDPLRQKASYAEVTNLRGREVFQIIRGKRWSGQSAVGVQKPSQNQLPGKEPC